VQYVASKSGSHIFELPLIVSPSQERALLVRLDCARQLLYNACLDESLRRLRLLRESKAFKSALKLKGKPRAEAFKALNEKFGFREYGLHAYCAKAKNESHFRLHLDINACQKIATRAFKAVQQYGFGKRGKPRFKAYGQFDSVEGKTNASGILWRASRVVWSGLDLPAMFDPKDTQKAIAISVRNNKITKRNSYLNMRLPGSAQEADL
jgi:hypothetical protein